MTAAIILAGHHPDGRSGLDWVAPRLVWPIAGLPLVHWLLRWIRAAGIARVALCCGAQAGAIRQQLDDGADRLDDIDYVIDQVPRGPAGCARDAAELIAAERYLVVEGGLLSDLDLGQVLDVHCAQAATATVVVAAPCDGRRETCTPAGVFVFERAALRLVPEIGYQDIKETLLPRLYADGALVISVPAPRRPLRVQTLDSYLAAQAWGVEFGTHIADPRAEYLVAGHTLVHPSAQIAATGRLIGPLLVGPEVTVADGAVVIGPAALGARSTLGRRSVLGRCVLWNDCRVGDDVHLEDCVLTTGTRVADGQTGVRQVLRGRARWHVAGAELQEWAL